MAEAAADRTMIRFGYLMATSCVTVGVAISAVISMPTALIWNASASVPIGLYAIAQADRFEVSELVAVALPESLSQFMVERGYVGRDVPILKRVLGLPGQEVCRADRTITVDRIKMGAALDRDRFGRALPVWQGCRMIAGGELFLMNWHAADSFDGRYFGPIPATSVIGRAMPLWTDEDGDGRYEWRAPSL